MNERVLLGANLGALLFDLFRDDTTSSSATRLGAEATYYPVITHGIDVLVRGGIGGAELTLQDHRAFGLGASVGAAVERRIGSSVALGMGLDGHFARLEGDVSAAYWEASISMSLFL